MREKMKEEQLNKDRTTLQRRWWKWEKMNEKRMNEKTMKEEEEELNGMQGDFGGNKEINKRRWRRRRRS